MSADHETPAGLSDQEWREFQAIPEQGYSHRGWVDSKITARLAAQAAAHAEEAARWQDKAQEAGQSYALANSKHHEELDRANRLERLADTLAGRAVDLEDRARSAEAERDDLRAKVAGVEALFGWGVGRDTGGVDRLVPASEIRAVLATPPAVQREAEVGARVLREAADEIAAWDTRSGDIEQARVEVFLHARADALTDTAGSGA